MDRRRLLASAFGTALLVSAPARSADRAAGKRRLAVLLFDSAETWVFFRTELGQELGALGWVEGRNLAIDWRFGDNDAARLRAQAAELVAAAPDAILARGTPATRALRQVTRTIPILTGVGDPVGDGFARTLARPGGNITGLSWAFGDQAQKQMELLHKLVPRLKLVLVVAHSSRAPFASDIVHNFLEPPARARGLATRIVLLNEPADLQRALGGDAGGGEAAAIVFGLGKDVEPADVARVALAAKLPTMFEYRFYVDAGGLASYRLDWENQTQRAAAQIDKVFRGEKPAQIPFEMPTRSTFVLNRTTARVLGLSLPRSLLSSVDEFVD